MTQTQHHTTPQHNGTIPPNQVGPLVPQPPFPILHAGALPIAPPLPTPPAYRITGNADDSIGPNHVTMNVGPQDDITTFLLHIRRRAAGNANSSSHDMTTSSTTTNTDMTTSSTTTNTDVVANTATAADDTNALSASGANTEIAIDIATDAITNRCDVDTGDAANNTMTSDDPEPQHNGPDDDTPVINVDTAPTVDITADIIDIAIMAIDQGAHAQPNSGASVVPVRQQRQRKRRCSPPAKIKRQQRRRCYDGQDLCDTARTPDSGGAQTGGDGRGQKNVNGVCSVLLPLLPRPSQ